jgi:transposase
MRNIGRPRAEVVVTDEERAALVRLTKRARVNRAVAFRARIVLACIDTSDTAVARRLRTTKTTVAKWRSQFVQRRLEGLYDEPRVGAPRTISDEQVEAILVKTLETTPPGETHWSTRSMAKAAGVSHTMVGRIWRTFRLQPHRTESFKISPDPQPVEKIRDVVGLYVAPPANAVVFSSTRNRRSRPCHAPNHVTSPCVVHTSVAKKSAAMSAGQCACTNVRHGVARCPPAGMPCARSTRAIVERLTRCPTFINAP